VRLVTTDLDWSHGNGPEVRGSGGALLMTMAGRWDSLPELTGHRQPKFAHNIGGD
jgi:hypothetical protein